MALKYQAGGVKVTIGQSQDVAIPSRVFLGRATCMHFDTDKSFLLPPSVPGVRNIVSFFHRHSGATMLVNGHTDLVGDAPYNLQLSSERAAAVTAYLLNKIDDWLAWYKASIPSKRWSYLEDQHMLATVTDPSGQPYYGGEIHGLCDAATQAAASRFQSDSGLPGSGTLDDATRRALIGRYMALEGTSLPAGTPIQQHGCGKSHPIDATTQADQGNRRVEIFLFDGPVDPPPPTPCPSGGCASYPAWVAQALEDVDLCAAQPLCDLDVVIVDPSGAIIPGANVTISPADRAPQLSGDDGQVSFLQLPAATYTLVATRAGYADTTHAFTLDPDADAAPAPAPASSTLALADRNAKTAPRAAAGATTRRMVMNPLDLVVEVLHLLSLAGSPTPTRRWANGGSARLGEVLVALRPRNAAPQTLTASGTTDDTGRVGLSLKGVVDGDYELEIQPIGALRAPPSATAGEDEIAGPLLNPPQGTKQQFRRHFIDLSLLGEKLDTGKPIALRGTNIRDANIFVDTTTRLKITVDSKPVWVGSKNTFARSAKDIFPHMFVVHRTDGKQSVGPGHFIDEFAGVHPNAHFLLDVDGHAIKFVRDDLASGHINKAFWNGDGTRRKGDEPRLQSIGCEIFNGRPDAAFSPDPKHPKLMFNAYTPQQEAAIAELIAAYRQVYGLKRCQIVGHGDIDADASGVALTRERLLDPGVEFDWAKLAVAGHAVKTDPSTLPAGEMTTAYDGLFATAGSGTTLKPGAHDPVNGHNPVIKLQQYLSFVGYSINTTDGTTVSGTFTPAVATALLHFQVRAFSGGGRKMQQILAGGGTLDEETARRLRAAVLDVAADRGVTPP